MAGWAAPALVVALVVGALARGLPASGEGGFWETAAQGLLLVVYAVAALAAWRWPMPAATVMTVMAFGIGVLATLDYPPWFGLLLALVLWAPAGLQWLVWQRDRPLPAVAALAAVLLVCLVAGGYGGTSVYDYVQGPQTAQSSRPAYPSSAVRWVWATGVTTSSFDVVARVDATEARLVYGTAADLSGPVVRTAARTADADTGAVRFSVGGLDPATVYHYAVEVEGVLDLARQGRVRTFPSDPGSVTVAFASCARTGSNAEVFETIRRAEPDLFLMTGDLHYSDIAENRLGRYVEAYDTQLGRPAPQALYLSTPVVYMWDDHDYGPDDGDRLSRSRPAALASYRSLGAHYPLALPGPDAPVAQAFSIGRVRVIVTDLRSARDPSSAPDDESKSMMGAEQRAWFERELVQASRTHDAVVWVSSVPWIVGTDSPGDSWGAYSTERSSLSRLIAEQQIDNLVMVAGDAHMLAADDGSHNDYAGPGEPGFPVLQAAALDRPGSVKGGPYSQGSHPGAGQFGLLTISGLGGDQVRLVFEGRTVDGQVLVSLDTTL